MTPATYRSPPGTLRTLKSVTSQQFSLPTPFFRTRQKLELNTEIIQKDIFKLRDIETGTIMSRAFKPMPIILDLVQKNFRKYKNIILFMGKSGRKILNETLKIWDLDYEEKKSLTNKDSFLLNIKNMEKKI